MIASLEETRDFAAWPRFCSSGAGPRPAPATCRCAWPTAPGLPPTNSRPIRARVQKTAVDMTDLIGDRFLVTASGSRMREIAAEPEKGLCLIQVLDRQRFWLIDGRGQLSSEWPTHAGLHSLFKESRSGERAVVHCHPLNLIALSHIFNSEKEMNDRIFRMQHETRLFVPEMLGLIPYAVTGSKDLAKASKEKLKKYRLALWDKHGVIACGKDPGPGPGPDRDRGESGGHLPAAEKRRAGAGGPERRADRRDPARLQKMKTAAAWFLLLPAGRPPACRRLCRPRRGGRNETTAWNTRSAAAPSRGCCCSFPSASFTKPRWWSTWRPTPPGRRLTCFSYAGLPRPAYILRTLGFAGKTLALLTVGGDEAGGETVCRRIFCPNGGSRLLNSPPGSRRSRNSPIGCWRPGRNRLPSSATPRAFTAISAVGLEPRYRHHPAKTGIYFNVFPMLADLLKLLNHRFVPAAGRMPVRPPCPPNGPAMSWIFPPT